MSPWPPAGITSVRQHSSWYRVRLSLAVMNSCSSCSAADFSLAAAAAAVVWILASVAMLGGSSLSGCQLAVRSCSLLRLTPSSARWQRKEAWLWVWAINTPGRHCSVSMLGP